LRDLILSDIHANWEGLEAALAAATGRYDRIVCCGDLVGYGADPNRVVEWARANVALVVRGNHDKAAVGLENLEWFNPAARASALWTRQELAPENLEWVRSMPRGPMDAGGYDIAHGSPFDEDEYLIDAGEAEMAFDCCGRTVTFFGHTHVQGGFVLRRRMVRRLAGTGWKESEAAVQLDPDETYLINPGSTGQPRDGDPRAAFAIYDHSVRCVTYCRTQYNIAAAQVKIRKAGLPELLAERLAVGK
jgi:diadenosine tetraphosphatase ApaH/serine/threonine PP2A family protein phosphatase